MGIYISAACQSLSEWIVGLAVIGGIVVYALIGAFIFLVIQAFAEDLDWEFILLCIFVWPIIIAGGIVYAIIYYIGGYLFKLFAMPIVVVDKYDLKVSEDKIMDKIALEDNKIMEYLECDYVPPKKSRKPTKAKSTKKKKGKK